jgi:hypothetical protein
MILMHPWVPWFAKGRKERFMGARVQNWNLAWAEKMSMLFL